MISGNAEEKWTESMNLVLKWNLQFNTECQEMCHGLDELIKVNHYTKSNCDID